METTTPSKVDVIIVLGYPATETGKPSPVMKRRVEKAVDLFKQGFARSIILSGDAVKNPYNEAEVMADYAQQLGVPEEALIPETQSQDTIQNAEKAVEIMNDKGWESAIVVTSPYHTRRAQYLFSKYDKDIAVVSANRPSDQSIFRAIYEIVYEYVVFAWYLLTGSQK